MPKRSRRRFSLAAYRRLTLSMFAFVLCYLGVAYWGGKYHSRGELFPVFNWSLFTYVYETRVLVELSVSRIGDQTFDEPVPYYDLGLFFDSARIRSIDVQKNLDRLVGAIRRGDKAAAGRLRRVLEEQHLSGRGTVDYRIESVIFEPLDRWKNDAVIGRRLIAEFATGVDDV